MLGRLSRISLSVFSLILVEACAHAPPVTICISDPEALGFQCVNPEKESIFLPYADSANYMALSAEDAQTLIQWIKVKCQK